MKCANPVATNQPGEITHYTNSQLVGGALELLFPILTRAIAYFGQHLISECKLRVTEDSPMYLGFNLLKFSSWDIAQSLRFALADFEQLKSSLTRVLQPQRQLPTRSPPRDHPLPQRVGTSLALRLPESLQSDRHRGDHRRNARTCRPG